MKFVANIRTLLIGIWLGAAVFFSFAVAPSAFAVLPTRELAGQLVSRSLMIVQVSGIIVAVLAFFASYAGASKVSRASVWLERGLLALVALACAVGQFVIASLLAFTKATMGRPIDEVAVDDPLRIQFNNLHEYSVWVLVAAMIAGTIAFFVIGLRNGAVPPPAATEKLAPFDFEKEFKI